MLQTPTMNDLLLSEPSQGERAAVVSLILVLNELIEKKMRTGLAVTTNMLQVKEKGETKLHLKDVNTIFGWAIKSVRDNKQSQSFKLRIGGGD